MFEVHASYPLVDHPAKDVIVMTAAGKMWDLQRVNPLFRVRELLWYAPTIAEARGICTRVQLVSDVTASFREQ